MGPNFPGEANLALARHGIFTKARLLFALGFLVLFVFSMSMWWMTRGAMANLPTSESHESGNFSAEAQGGVVDVRPWQTAQALAALADTVEESQYARNAQRLADHEVDQAFASALRRASNPSHALAGEALSLSQRIAQLQEMVREDQANVRSLTEHSPAALPEDNGAAPAGVVGDLDIAKAQLGLDSDELAEAQQDLARAAGDERARIQQELAAHESAMHAYDAQVRGAAQVATIAAQRNSTLAGRLGAWLDQRSRYRLIAQAKEHALADAKVLIASHNRLGAEALGSAAAGASDSLGNRAAQLVRLKSQSAQRELQMIYDDRIQTQQQLAAVYGKWAAQVSLEHRITQHLLFQSFWLITFILLCATVLDGLLRNFVDRPALDRRRIQTLRIIFVFGTQFVAAVLILLVIFGVPSHMPTILGFTTAGLTVVLQDFIIAFLGWFILMSKNGIRIGDWVEINGVGGEVVEVGLFRTAMLETGNWTDKGHPTGRRVTFINSFAIKGQYFNFSTTGQWMWDEITVNIPAGDDTYEMIDLIRKAVLKETEKDAKVAGEEWKRVTLHNGLGLSQFTVSPAVDMRPSASGMSIIVRYVTRASDRFEARNRIFQCVIDVLHKRLGPGSQTGPSPLTAVPSKS